MPGHMEECSAAVAGMQTVHTHVAGKWRLGADMHRARAMSGQEQQPLQFGFMHRADCKMRHTGCVQCIVTMHHNTLKMHHTCSTCAVRRPG